MTTAKAYPALQCDNLLAFPLAMSTVLPDCLMLNTSSPAWKEVQQTPLDVTSKRNVWFSLVSCEKQAAPESRAVGVGSVGIGAYNSFGTSHQHLQHQKGSIPSRADSEENQEPACFIEQSHSFPSPCPPWFYGAYLRVMSVALPWQSPRYCSGWN